MSQYCTTRPNGKRVRELLFHQIANHRTSNFYQIFRIDFELQPTLAGAYKNMAEQQAGFIDVR